MGDCIFCQIVDKKAPAKIYYEDEHSIAFPTLNPAVDGHVMVIPKHHATNMLDIDTNELKLLVESTQEVARRVVKEFKPTGFNLMMANGTDAHQSVFHLHWHIVPRRPNDRIDSWIEHWL
jgi:histidine triad (HIT) family protein